MFNVQVIFSADPIAWFNSITAFLEHADDQLFEASVEAYAVTTPPTLDALAVVGAPVAYPLNWASEAQKRAVKAKLRRQGNLPYRRANGYVRGWTIAVLREQGGSRFLLQNASDHALWVGGGLNPAAPGAHQQPMFAGRWQQNAPIVAQWANEVIARTSANFLVRMKQVARITGQQVVYE